MKQSTLDLISCFIAEFIGTGLLVCLGCMGCIVTDTIPNTHLQMVIAFGLVVMALIEIFGCVSGGHFNPSVTIAAYVYKLITLPMVGIYFVAQMLGGFIGFGILKALVPAEAIRANNSSAGLCSTVPRADISIFQALIIEFIITMVLILICCGVWDPRNAKHGDSAAIKFGFTITTLACVAGPWTGASMNPARSFGPAIWNGDFDGHWIYWVGPLFAAIVTSLAYRAVLWRDVKPQKPPTLDELPLSRNNA